MLTEPDCAAIVKSVIGLAQDLQIGVVAEGVETAQQQQLLRELGCSEMQGYLFSAPKPAAQIRELLAGHRQGPAAGAAATRRRKPVAGAA